MSQQRAAQNSRLPATVCGSYKLQAYVAETEQQALRCTAASFPGWSLMTVLGHNKAAMLPQPL